MFPSLLRRGPAAPIFGARAVALCILFVLSIAVPAASQQTGTVRGTVVEAGSGLPLAGVSVTVEGTGLGTLSDARGRYLIAGVPAGSRQVVARRLGYEPGRAALDLAAGASATLDLRLAEQAVLLPAMVVSATRETQRLSETAATVGVVSSETLRGSRPTHPAEVMGQIPGVWVSVTGGEGHMTAIRQPKSTNPVYLFLEDGVPTRSTGFFNHNALYEVNVPQAERIEVLKGPATALYGSDAIGGVINVETRRPSLAPAAEAFAEAGAFGYNRLLLSGSGSRGDDGVRADVNLTRTDGWREGTGYERQSATLRWDHAFAGGATLRTTIAASRIDQQTAGSSSLLRDDYLSNPTLNYAPISLRNVRAARFSSAFEQRTGSTLVSVTPYLRWNEMELLPDWSLSYDPTIYTTGHGSAGVLAKVRRDFEPFRTRVIAGVDVDYSPGDRLEHRVVATREGQVFTGYSRGEVLYDYDVTFRSVSPYLQAEASPTERLHLTAGLRYDRMGYRYDSHLEEVQTGRWRRPADADVSYQHLSPKLGLTYDFGRALNVYGNYTHGFRAPSEGQLFRQGSAVNTLGLEPVVANSAELGLRGELAGRLGYSLAAYRMTVENDVLGYVHPDGTRETQNAGETLHRGIEAGLGLRLSEGLRADMSYSLARHSYQAWSPLDGVDYAGNEIESAPRVLLNARLAYSPGLLTGTRLTAEWSRIGGYWLDAANTHRYRGHGLLSLHAILPVSESVELVGRVQNVLNERYAESATYTQARGEELAPGLPRSLYLGAQYRWRGEGER